MKRITTEMGQLLARQQTGFSWQSSKSRLHRPVDSGWQAIAISTLPTPTAGVVKFAAHAQVRIDALEDMYLPLHPFIGSADASFHPTLVINCDSLLKDRSLAHGFRTEPEVLQTYAIRYAAEIRETIVPWLERYSSEDELLAGLSNPDPKRWVTSDRLIRYPVLMAIFARRGDLVRFIAIRDEFEAYCEQPHAKAYKPLAAAMAKMHIGAST